MSSETAVVIVASIGAVTGVISLISQWWSNRFKLVFERASVVYEPDAVAQLSERSAEHLCKSFFEFEIEIQLLNRASGRGSIEKPRLEVRLPDGTSIVQYPDTQETKSEEISGQPGARRIWVERWGNSYSIAPRERLDDALAYLIAFDDGEQFLAFLQSFDALSFSLVYRDHRGREQRRPVTDRVAVDKLI